jgi:hypothetical protein
MKKKAAIMKVKKPKEYASKAAKHGAKAGKKKEY